MLHLVRAQVADAIVAHSEPATHAELIRLLARPGCALHPQSRCRTGVFAFEVFRAVRGRFDRRALLVAAAVELQIQSGTLFDSLSALPADGRAAGGLALAVTVLVAAAATAADASDGSPDPSEALRQFFEATGGPGAGPEIDGRLRDGGRRPLEGSVRTMRLQAGSLGRFAAGFAARAAGADAAGATLFERLGFNLFTFAQLQDRRRGTSAPGAGSAPAPAPPAFATILALSSLGRAHADLLLLSERGYAMQRLRSFLEGVEADAPAAGPVRS